MRRFLRADGAQAMVEFALVLPIILLLLFGMLQFALVLNARQTVAYAAQAAANGYAQTLQRARADSEAQRAGAQLRPVFATAGAIEYRIVKGTVPGRFDSGLTEAVITADGVGAFGDLVVARTTYRYPSPVRAGIGPFRFPDTIELNGEAVARIEAPGGAGAAPSGAVAAATPSPTPTPARTATATAAGCFYFSGFPTLPFPLDRVIVDGSSAVTHRYFAPGSSHSLIVWLSVPIGFFHSRVSMPFPVTVVVPGSGVVGTAYDVRHDIPLSGSWTGTVTIVTRVTGTAAQNCIQGQPPR